MGGFLDSGFGLSLGLGVAVTAALTGCSSPAYSIPHENDGESGANVGGTSTSSRRLSSESLSASSAAGSATDGKRLQPLATVYAAGTGGTSSAGGMGGIQSSAASTAAATTATSACRPGWDDCNASAEDGCEVQLATHPEHCGACDETCSSANGVATCSNGHCGIVCASGYADCDGALANGCETDLTTSTDHCGACEAACGAVANGGSICRTGECELSQCTVPYGDCDGNSTNGCESNADTDVLNCGGCGRACNLPHAEAACAERACVVSACEAGWADCNGLAKDGCEIHLLSSTSHCGACNTECAPAGGAGACVQGKCSVDSCQQAMADCNQASADGCETDVFDDVSNCGGCGLACNGVHGTPSCSSGACAIACASGYGNCDNLASNGCETDTSSSLDHCGGCNRPCEGKCVAGKCVTTPCSGICDNPIVFVINSGSITGISQKICHESYEAARVFSNGSCGEFATGKQLYINRVAVPCPNGAPWDFTSATKPAVRNGGYCFHDDLSGSNGTYAWINTW